MSDREWSDRIAGDRMAVDQEFASTVENSQFSRQQWGLIMTAVEFEVEQSTGGEDRLVANTDNLPHIMPELDNVGGGMGGMGAMGDEGSGGSDDGGVFGSIKSALGMGGGDGGTDQERIDDAERLTQRYADELQQRLEERGKWDDIRASAKS
ncbi:DUF5799 family protein [Halococcus saccharolyticus]|uniref:Uncharacterized protein n=1 Tax=Halococcus saccharolyticus DSM 5350 TaxID=1227455 RepID=M0MG26_9EURY|nr:DUF5799 family protein [Halococcus saccharolyticus]EMA44677.1 hypothetical protein C449_08469 [Halococcus saccharolyticus DSM 5350]